MAVDRVRESNDQVRKAWQFFARTTPRGEVKELDGVTIADAKCSWPIMNAAMLSSPVSDIADLRQRVAVASAHFERSGRMWILAACQDWLPSGAEAVFQQAGLNAELEVTGMAADRIAPPQRPLPKIEVRNVAGEDTRNALADINSISYDVPLEWGRETVALEGLWRGPVAGYVGYVDSQPVTTSAAFLIDDAIYIGLVATINQYRRTGFAETVMRHALEEARRVHGIERTILHATPAGLAIYQRMGYEPVTKFTICVGQG